MQFLKSNFTGQLKKNFTGQFPKLRIPIMIGLNQQIKKRDYVLIVTYWRKVKKTKLRGILYSVMLFLLF